MTAIYRTPQWRQVCYEIRAEAERVNALCPGCGRNPTQFRLRTHVHHLKSPKSSPWMVYEPSNLVLICEECHRHEHGLDGAWSRRAANDDEYTPQLALPLAA